MSIEALSMVLNHSRALGSPKVVLLGIANHLGPDATEGAWPSQQRLAEYANMSERGVQKCIDKLVALGELRVEVAGGVSRDKYKPNRYWITIECPEDCDRSMSHRRGERQYAEGRTSVPLGTNAGTSRGEPQFVQTVIEPEDKPKSNLKATKKDHRIPEGWKPSQRLLDMFATKWPDLEPVVETETFILYWESVTTKKTDWDKTYMMWMNREQQKQKKFSRKTFQEQAWDKTLKAAEAFLADEDEATEETNPNGDNRLWINFKNGDE
jgi:hypothetical protein